MGCKAEMILMPNRIGGHHHHLFIMKFVQLGTQIKTRCEKRKKKKIYKNTQKVHYEVHKNHIIKSTSDTQNSEI